jgi:hypothetical protein
VAVEVDSRVAVDHWKSALKKGRPIWVCKGWKVPIDEEETQGRIIIQPRSNESQSSGIKEKVSYFFPMGKD